MPEKKLKTYLIQLSLFLITCFTCTFFSEKFLGLPDGAKFSIPFLAILTVHEFGHYIASKLYKIKVTLPYFIPFIGIIGTMGAFIQIKSVPKSRKQFFDVGIAGPLAGFVLAFAILIYAFVTLPPLDYLYEIHEDYAAYGADYAQYAYQDLPNDSTMVLAVGDNLLFKIMEEVLVEDKSRIPHAYEMAHYPLLMAGFFALFFTAINLLPIGQLDGGHVLYGILGRKKHKVVSDIFYVLLVTVGGLEIVKGPIPLLKDFFEELKDFIPLASFESFIVFTPLYLLFLYFAFFKRFSKKPVTNILATVLVFVMQYTVVETWTNAQGFLGYLVFALIIGRFLGTGHPPALSEKPLGLGRKVLGWLAILIFVLSFSFEPFYMVM